MPRAWQVSTRSRMSARATPQRCCSGAVPTFCTSANGGRGGGTEVAAPPPPRAPAPPPPRRALGERRAERGHEVAGHLLVALRDAQHRVRIRAGFEEEVLRPGVAEQAAFELADRGQVARPQAADQRRPEPRDLVANALLRLRRADV